MSLRNRPALMASVWDRPFTQIGPRSVQCLEGASLAEIVRHAIPDPILASHVRIQLDGDWIERDEWDRVPTAGAHLTLAVRPAGGESGNKFLRTLLQVAVVALATWVGAGAGGAIANGFLAAAAGATVLVVGNLAINALVPPPQPRVESDRFDPGYSIEGARNQLDRYGSVLVSFGETRIFPKFQGLPYQEVVGDDTYIRFLLSLGPMPLAIDPASIKIGETEISTFDGVEIETRLTPSDPPLTLYANDPFAEVVGARLTPDAGWVERTTAPGVTEIIAVIAFPVGLGGKSKKGNDVDASATVEIQYQPVEADPVFDPWFSRRAGAPAVNDALNGLGETRLRTAPFTDFGGLESRYGPGVGSGPITYRRREASKPFKREIRFAVPQGQYRVRVRRTDPEIDDGRTANRVQFEQLISISPADPNPEPRHGVMAVRIKASDQLSGVVDTLNLVARRIAPTLDLALLEGADPDLSQITADNWAGVRETASPADAALFAMRGPMVANPKSDDEIDWPAWAGFARWCHAQNYRFDFALSRPMSRGDFVRMACAAGRARPMIINGKWSVVIDAPRQDGPRQLFTARNVRNFRVVKTFPGEVHALRVRFPNRLEGYREDERLVFFEGYSKDGSEPGTQAATIIEALDLPGVTHPDQVYQLARFYGATAVMQSERFSFDCDIEYLVSNYGDLVAVQHPVMVLGKGAGRIRDVELDGGGAVTAITLDRDVEMDAGERYGVGWRRVNEPVPGQAEIEVQGSFEVVTTPGVVTRLEFVEPISPSGGPVPQANDLIAFGVYGMETDRALIKAIEPRTGFDARLDLVLEAPERYQAGEGPIPVHNTALVTPVRRRPPSPVLEAVNVANGEIHISFTAPAGYEARIATIESSWRKTPGPDGEARWIALMDLGGEARALTFIPPDPSDEYDFQITLVDSAGRRSDPALVVRAVAADNIIDPPRNVVAIGAVLSSANGVRQPVLQIAAEPDEDQTLTDLVVEIRPSGSSSETDFQPLAILPPDRPNRDVRDVPPGATLDVGFRYRARRGERVIFSEYVIVQDVAIPEVLVSQDAVLPTEAINKARDAINDALQSSSETLADAQTALAQRASQSAELSLLNWLNDPLFTSGLGGWVAHGGAVLPVSGAPRGLQAYWQDLPAGVAPDQVLDWPERKPVKPDRHVQAAARITVSGVVDEVILEAVWFDKDEARIASAVIARGFEGRIEGVGVAPAGAAGVSILARPVGIEAGAGGFTIREPLAAYALPGQSGANPFQDPESELVARIETLTRVVANMVERERRLQVEDRRARASITRTAKAIIDEEAARIEVFEQLSTQFTGFRDDIQADVATRATIERLGEVESSLTQSLAREIERVQSEYQAADNAKADLVFVNEALTNESQARAQAVGQLRTQFQSADGTIAAAGRRYADQAVANEAEARATAINTLTAQFDDVQAEVRVNAAAISDIEGAVAYYEVIVEADGSNPAVIELVSGKGGSAAIIAGDQVVLQTHGQSGLTTALSARNGGIVIPNKLTIEDTGQLAVEIGNGGVYMGRTLPGGRNGFVLMDDAGNPGLIWDPLAGVYRISGAALEAATVGGQALVAGAVTDGIGVTLSAGALPANGTFKSAGAFNYDCGGGVLNMWIALDIGNGNTETGVEVVIKRNGVQVGRISRIKPYENFQGEPGCLVRRVVGVPVGLASWSLELATRNTQGGVSGVSVPFANIVFLETRR